MKKRGILIPALIMCFYTMHSQNLFEKSLAPKENGAINIHGFLRSGLFGSKDDENGWSTSTLFAQPVIQMKAKAGEYAKAYADIRFRTGRLFYEPDNQIDIREAYVDLNTKRSSVRIGKQILAYGRADGINPTDQLSPKDLFYRTPDVEDLKMGVIAVQVKVALIEYLRVEGTYQPIYTPSYYAFDKIGLPPFVKINPTLFPPPSFSNGIWRTKIDLLLSKIECSLSWQRGYDPLPSLNLGAIPVPPFDHFTLNLNPIPYKTDIIGGDFAFFIGKTGFRGEWAWKDPLPDQDPLQIIPLPELSYTLSIDQSIGSSHIVIAYYGKWIKDFIPIDNPDVLDPTLLNDPQVWGMLPDLLGSYLQQTNRILFDQTDEWLHSLIIHPSGSLFHETVNWELTGLYNLTTKEYLIWPTISWKATEGCQLGAGYQYYHGLPETRFAWISKLLNGPYLWAKLTF